MASNLKVVSAESESEQAERVGSVKVHIISTMLATRGLGEWGFSALVEVDGHWVLLDTGHDPDVVLGNAETMGVDLSRVTDVVLSHFHPDHTGGLGNLGAFAAFLFSHNTRIAIFAFGLGGAKPWFVGVFGGLAAYAGFFSLVWPKANLPVYLGLTILSYPIGFVLSHVIMGALFFFIITPVGLVFRVMGKDPLNRKYEPDADSYWVDSRPERAKESYFRQF